MTFLYIDPGTGSMLFSLAIGVATTLVFVTRALAVKIRFVLSGGKAAKISANKIPYVIFSDHKRYWNVFKPICDEFENRKILLVYYTQSPDDPALSEKYEFVKAEFIGEGNKGFVKMNMLNAGTVLSTTPGLDVLQWKRSKNVDWYVHIPHSVTIGYRMFGFDHYDAILLTGEYQITDIRNLEKLRNRKPKELLVVGSTYMDAAFSKVKSLEHHDCDFENPTVLLAPSWGKTAILSKYGEKLIDELVKTGFKVIVRPHPQSSVSEKDLLSKLEEKYKDCANIEWNYDNDNLAVLNKADIMISDFSSVVLDYVLLFDRPILYSIGQYDTGVYDAAWLDYPEWRIAILPEIGIELKEENFSNIKQILLDTLKSESLSSGRKKAKSETWMYEGESVKRIVDYLCKNSGESEIKK